MYPVSPVVPPLLWPRNYGCICPLVAGVPPWCSPSYECSFPVYFLGRNKGEHRAKSPRGEGNPGHMPLYFSGNSEGNTGRTRGTYTYTFCHTARDGMVRIRPVSPLLRPRKCRCMSPIFARGPPYYVPKKLGE